MAAEIDPDEGFILDLSDDSISPLSTPERSDHEEQTVWYEARESIPDPESDRNEVDFYFREGVVVGINPDGTPILEYPKLSGLEGKTMTEELFQASVGKIPTYMDFPQDYTQRELTLEEFRWALKVYENNQMLNLSNPDMDYLSKLESWFMLIYEPKPLPKWKGTLRGSEILEYNQDIEEWIQREKTKLKGYTYYCDYSLRRKLKIQPEVMVVVRQKVNELIQMKNTGKFSRRR